MIIFKTLYLIFGILATALGFVGIFIPGLPTVPFVLLAAWLFMKGSPKLDLWIRNHQHLGPIIQDYKKGKGVQIKTKMIAIGSMILSVITTFLLMESWWVRGSVAFFILIGMAVMIFLIPTQRRKK